MVIDDLISSAESTYLVVTHIPLQGHGYQILHNFDAATPGLSELVNGICHRLTAPMRARFQADGATHSLFEYILTDNTALSLYASRIDSASFDEMGRKGIVHGVYLQQRVDHAAWIRCDRFFSRFEDCFLKIEEEHRRLRESTPKSSDSDRLVARFVDVLRETLRDFVSSPELLEVESALQTPDGSQITSDPPEPWKLQFPHRRRFTRLWQSDQRRWWQWSRT
jgi:hypothetical protein